MHQNPSGGKEMMYAATYLIDIAALFTLLGLLQSSTAVNPIRKKPFSAGVILTILIILAEAGTIATANGNLGLRELNLFFNVTGFLLTPLIPVAITLIFDSRIFATHKFVLIPTVLHMAAVLLSPGYGLIFRVDGNNDYFRGEYFFLFILVYIFNFLLLVISTLAMGRKYNYPIRKKLLALSIFLILGTSIQLLIPSAYSSWHSVTLALILYFLLLSEFDASFDVLTGLYNRTTFEKALKAMAKSTGFSVIILDINDFKRINDTFGHDYGDQVIKTVASVVRASFQSNYICYRYGGDEFSVLSKETDREKIQSQLTIMTQALREIRENGMELPTVSYGYSVFMGEEDVNVHKTIKEADDQMYHYKKQHKANVEGELPPSPLGEET